MVRKKKNDKPTKGIPKSKKDSPAISTSKLLNPKSGFVNSQLAALRKKAEKKLAKQTNKLHKLSGKDVERLIHELGTHQIELEMQNEELRRAQEELESSRSRYSDLYDFAPVGYFTFNEKGLILEANLTAARELGVERGRIIKQLFRVFVITKDRTIFDDHLREVFKSESRQTCEVRLNRKSGVEFYARLESILAQDLNGNNVCRTSLIDITESKKTETLLKDERDFISAVLSTEGALVVVLDLQGKIVSFNKTCELITGYSFDEVKGKPLWDFLLIPEEVKPVKAVFKELKTGQYPNKHENYWVTKDGRYRFISWANTSLLDSNGNIKYIIGTGIDITERKRAEDETKRFASFPQLNPNPVLEVNSSGIIVFSNAATVQTLRKLDIRDANVFLPFDIANILAALEQEKEIQLYREVKIKDRIFEEVLYLTPQFDSIRIYANDITERKAYQEALKNALQQSRLHEETLRSERQKLTNILDSMVDGVYIVDQKYHIEYVNPEIEKEYGPVNDLSCHEYFEGRKKACTWCKNQEVFKGKTVRWEWFSEKTNKTYDLINTPLKNPDGSVSKLGIFRDITERKQAEEALLESEKKFKTIFDGSVDGILVADEENKKFLMGNKAICNMLGYNEDEIENLSVMDIHPKEDLPFVEKEFEKTARQETFLNENIPVKRKDGSVFYVDITASHITLSGKKYVVGSFRDITERKQAEEALRESREDLDRAQAVGNIGSWRMDVQRNILTWSDENHRIFGLPKGTPMTYETFLSIVHPDDREYVDTKWKAGLAGEDYDIVHRIIVDGQIKWVREKAYLEFDKNSALLGGFGITQDITERKLMEEELRKSRDELEMRIQERTAELNEAQNRMKATNDLLSLFVTKSTRKEYLNSVVELLHEWTDCNCIGIRILDKQGNIPYESYTGFSREFWEAENWISVKNHQCACIRVVLQKPEPQDMNMMTPNGSFHCSNTETFAGMLTEQELARYRGLCIRTGYKSVAIIPLRYKESVIGALHVADKQEGMVPLDKVEFIESVSPLIGEAIFRFSAEEALVKSEARLSEAERIALMGNWEWDIGNNVVSLSDELYRIFGIEKEKFDPTYQSFLNFVHPDDLNNLKTAIDEAVRKRTPFNIDFKFLTADGNVRFMHTRGQITYDLSGRPLLVRGTGQDITDRVKAENALSESEERYRMLIETMNEGLGMDNEDGLLIYANERLCEMLGYSLDEIIGRPVLSFFGEKNQTILREQIEKRKSGEEESYRLEWIRKDGNKIITFVSPRGIFNPAGQYKGSFAVITDITEKLRLESIAEAVNTMENIGFIFSGIRHEIGNPVNSIKMALSVLKKNIDSYSIDKIKEYADRMLEEISRMEYLLKAMKNFNMYETVELMDTNMTDFMKKFLSLVKGDFEKRGIKVEINVLEPAWVYADPRALQQVLLNILTNASDALEGQENPRITIDVSKMADMVNIRVEDNGSGMTEEQQEDLFKPFYTTKSKGTGLGLVIAKKMITKMKGFIEVVSEKNTGTIVDLFIPEGISE